MSKPKHIVTLIMAAGSSSRMGTAKQLLSWKDKTLIENTISNVLLLRALKPIVVLGANSEKISSKIKPYPIEIVHNPNWKKGLGNSIALGVTYVQGNYKVDGILVVLADQPLINSSYLKGMIDIFEIDKNQIIATKYPNGKLGVPVLFDKNYFEELCTIDGDKGAKAMLEKHSGSVTTIQLDTDIFDIDTEEDYKELMKQER